MKNEWSSEKKRQNLFLFFFFVDGRFVLAIFIWDNQSEMMSKTKWNQNKNEPKMRASEEEMNSEMRTEQIDNFIFIGYQMEFILVISLFIRTHQPS